MPDGEIELHDFRPSPGRFRAEVLHGLRKPQKELPSKYLYDERGSQLFEEISKLDEYYPPQAEVAIMAEHVQEIAELLGPGVLLIDYGSGNSAKARILLDHLREPAAYVPIDISRTQLVRAAEELASDYPDLEVLPVHADYTGTMNIPEPTGGSSRRIAYYPGSTIANFDPLPAKQFLERVADACGPDGALLISVDLVKDPRVFHRAYNDREGVTARFNKNLLRRINRELGADFPIEAFEHYAFYNPGEGRVEMHLVSQEARTVHIDGVAIPFSEAESIWTESSYKYDLVGFAELAGAAGFEVERLWTDEREWFSVQYLTARGHSREGFER